MSRFVSILAGAILLAGTQVHAALQPNGPQITVVQGSDLGARGLAMASDGSLAVTWVQGPDQGVRQGFIKPYTAAGLPVSSSATVASHETLIGLRVAILGSHGYVVTYNTESEIVSGDDEFERHELYFRLFDASGSARGPAILVRQVDVPRVVDGEPVPSEDQDEGIDGGNVSANASGEFAIGWISGHNNGFHEHNGTAFARKFDSNGQPLTGVVTVGTAFDAPRVALADSGEFVTAYQVATAFDDTPVEEGGPFMVASDLHAKRLSSNGSQTGGAIVVSGGGTGVVRDDPTVSYSPDGAQFGIGYELDDSFRLNFYQASNGVFVTGFTPVPGTAVQDLGGTFFSFLGNDEVLVAWEDDDDSFHRTFTTAGAATAAAVGFAGAILANGNGSAAALWTSGDRILLQRFTTQQGGGGSPPGGADTTPDQFVFVDQTDVAPGTLSVSNAVTITGINAPAPISVTGGDYAINGGAFAATAEQVSVGDSVRVRHTASGNYGERTDTVLSVGAVSDAFSTTTRPADDTNPNPFSFTDQNGVATGSTVTSNTITVAGLGSGLTAPVSVSGGRYRINAGSFVTTNGTVRNGDTVTLQHTASASSSTATNTTLTIGQVSDTFTSVTANPAVSIPLVTPPDTAPNPFSFMDQVSVPVGSERTSNAVTIAGIAAAASVSVTGGSYSVNGGPFVASAGTVNSGDTIAVRHTAAVTFDTVANTTLTVGGVSDTFSSQTISPPPAVGNSTSTTDANGDPVTFTQNNGVLVELMRVDAPEGAPSTFTYPNGFFSFRVTGVGDGGSTTVVLTLPEGADPSTYIKCGNTTCGEFPNAVINGNLVTLTLTDGDAFDTDPASGVIGDPGAPAVATGGGGGGGGGPTSDSGGGGGCALATGKPRSIDPTLWLLALLSLVLMLRKRAGLANFAPVTR